MNCTEARAFLGALLDDELDAKNGAEMRAHLAQCAACAKEYRALEDLRAGLRRAGMAYEAPESLRRRISRTITVPAESNWRQTAGRWVMRAGWPVAAAACALLVIDTAGRSTGFRDEVVAAHVRSLLAGHLSDVASSDHHTVKPWFAGKIDFSPPVPDLSSAGYSLVGGRLDYLDHQVVAAVVYRKRDHFINVLVRPPPARGASLPRASTYHGYTLRAWQELGLEFVAVSDLDAAELEAFQHAYASSSSGRDRPLP